MNSDLIRNETYTIENNDRSDLWAFLVALNDSRCKLHNESHATRKSAAPSMDAFFYIVVVLVFYASSIVLLLIKYSRKDDEEKFLNYQFAEYVKRDKFQAAQYKNSVALVRTKEVLATLDGCGHGIPVIVVHRCSESDESGQKAEDFANVDVDYIGQSHEKNETEVIVKDKSVAADGFASETNSVCYDNNEFKDGLETEMVVQN